MQFGVPGRFEGGAAERAGANVNPTLVRGMGMELTVVAEGKVTERHAITRLRVTIGRGLCDVRVHDPEVSREHCSITIRDGVPVLEDLKSANGTLVNGEVILDRVLADGDEIQIGMTILRIQIAARE